MAEPFIVEGYLNLESQEGGYAGPDWKIDGNSIDVRVAQHFGVEPDHYIPGKNYTLLPFSPGDMSIGRVRLTIELLSEDA